MIYIEENQKVENIIRIYRYLIQKYKCKVTFFADSLFNDIDTIAKQLRKFKVSFQMEEISDIRKSIVFTVNSEMILKIGLKNFSHYIEDSWVHFNINNSIIQINQLPDEGAEIICEDVYEKELRLILSNTSSKAIC